MVGEKPYFRFRGEHSQRQGFQGESRVDMTRAGLDGERQWKQESREPSAAIRSPRVQKGRVTKVSELY